MEDFQKQMEHDAGLIDVLTADKNRLRSERDEWRRKYFFMERAQSACIDKNGEMIKRIQFLEREKDELRDSLSRVAPKASPEGGAATQDGLTLSEEWTRESH